MVGAGVAVAKGHMPLSVLELAKIAPIYIPFPVAPAEGLVLVNAGFRWNDEVDNYIYCILYTTIYMMRYIYIYTYVYTISIFIYYKLY